MGSKPIIIGITGHPASGKDTIANYLVSQGFFKVSGGDILRQEMKKMGVPIDRTSIHEFSKKMREQRGNGYLSEETIKRIKSNTVVSGIRNTQEVKIFREKFGDNFKLIAVQTPLEIRYKRAKKRNSARDSISLEQFKQEEEKEKAAVSGSHEVDLVIALADVVIENNGMLEELFKKVDAAIWR